MTRKAQIVLILLTLLSLNGVAAQNGRKSPRPVPGYEIAASKAKVIEAATLHRADLEKEVPFLEQQLESADAEAKKARTLFEAGLIARVTLEQSEASQAQIAAKLEEKRAEIGRVDSLIAEARAEEEAARHPPLQPGDYQMTAALIRYRGPAAWSLSEIPKVEGFFVSRFARTLPISALGQTALHARLGFDHSNAVDIAIHPDSAEGQSLMSYLRSAGIPFIAFRQAVPGASTGAHIHIGRSSRRR